MSIWDNLNDIGKRPIVAKIGGFRPESIEFNMFGGGFYIKSGEAWPVDKSGYMIPLLQIKVNDVPEGRQIFGDIELLQVFINNKSLPMRHISPNGEGWLIKEYRSIDDMKLVDTPLEANKLKPFPIRWYKSKSYDYPCWEEAWNYVDLTEINESEDMSDRFFDEYTSISSTKIGGYASYIQSPIEDDNYEYIFQISSEEKPHFIIADNGNFYFYRCKYDGKWYLHWDCY